MTHDSERPAVDTAQAGVERAGESAQASVSHLRDRARKMGRNAADRFEDLTGRSLDSWIATLRGTVRDHPLQALALTVGLGYVVGKLARRG